MAADGSLLIADQGNQRIRRVDPDGTITTIAGSGDPAAPASSGDGGPATEARLDRPEAVAVTTDGTVAFTEADGTRVRQIAADGTIGPSPAPALPASRATAARRPPHSSTMPATSPSGPTAPCSSPTPTTTGSAA